MAQTVKNPPAVQETWVSSLGWDDPLEEGVATHSSILASEIQWTEEPGGLQSTGSQRVGHDWATNTLSRPLPFNYLILCHPLLLLPSIFPSITVFPRRQLFASGGQSIGFSASASALPMHIQDWFPLRLTGLIFLLFKRFSKVSSSTTIWKHQFFGTHPSLWSNSHICT